MQPSPTSRKDAARPYLFGAIFVWALTGAIAWAAFSSRAVPVAPANEKLDLSAIQDPAQEAARQRVGNSQSASLGAKFEAPKAPETVSPARDLANGIAWEPTFEGAMQRARKENLPLMIDFYTDWCSACKILDQEVYPDPKVVQEAKKWISIRIDAEKRRDVAGAYGVTGYPTIVFARKSGAPLLILPGVAPAPDFVDIMKRAHKKLG